MSHRNFLTMNNKSTNANVITAMTHDVVGTEIL